MIHQPKPGATFRPAPVASIGLALFLLLTSPLASAQDTTATTDDVTHPELRAELLQMREKDQAVRETLQTAFQKYDGEVPDSITFGLAMDMSAVDGKNVKRLKEILDEHGFPTRDMIGKEGVDAAFLLLQHAPLNLQEQYYSAVEAAYKAGDLDGQSLALLTDRIRVRNGEKQVYGTQTSVKNGELYVAPIADSARVDARRDSVGLPPLSEYLEKVRDMVGKQ